MRRGIHKAARWPAALLLPAVFLSSALCGCGPSRDLDTPGEALPDAGAAVVSSAPAYESREAGTLGTVTAEGAPQSGEPAGRDAQDDGTRPAEPAATPVVTAGGSSQETVEGIEDEILAGAGAPEPEAPRSWRDSIYASDISELPEDAHLLGMAALGIGDHSGAPYTIVHGGEPFFDIPEHPYDTVIFSALDDDGRVGPAYACMSAGELANRGQSESTKWTDRPAGWNGLTYYGIVPGGALYKKQALVPRSFYTGKLDGKNLFTATEYLRDSALGPLTDEIAEYLSGNGGYMAIRFTPIYSGANLICDGVLVEAASVFEATANDEDFEPLRLCVFCHNVQPGVEIDYRNGLARIGDSGWTGDDAYGNKDYVLNEHDGTFHYERCVAVMNMYESYRREYRGQRADLIDNKYEACRFCQP